METLLIAGACIVAIYAGFYMHLRLSLRFIAEQMANLDAKLAEALTSTIENLPLGDIPEVNPIQMMLMQLIQDNMVLIEVVLIMLLGIGTLRLQKQIIMEM